MIICPKCGNDNPLGRVFCGKCGSKLDFSHTSSQEMAVKKESGWLAANWPKLGYLVFLVVLVPVVLVLWSQPAAVGKVGTGGGEKRVEGGVKAVAAIKKGQIVNATFAEEDLNAYLQLVKAKQPGANSLSIALAQGYFKVRMVRPLFQLPAIKIKGNPVVVKLSYDLACVPLEGGAVTVSKAVIGHLPAVGPLKNVASKAIQNVLRQDTDWAPFMSITDIKVSDGQVTVTLKP